MSQTIFKDLSNSESREIENQSQYNIQMELKQQVVEGKESSFTEIKNPEQAIKNGRDVEKMLLDKFLLQIPDEKKREEIEASRSLYDEFKQDVLDWARDNYISWIIKLKLSPEHTAIADVLDENPKFNNFRQKTVKAQIEKWVKDGVIENKMIENLKRKDKKKLAKD